jgi:hypothetical protein
MRERKEGKGGKQGVKKETEAKVKEEEKGGKDRARVEREERFRAGKD